MDIRLKHYGKWLPADVQTPISLYLGLVGTAPGILLESAEVDGRLGRYSLIAWDFRLLAEQKHGKLALTIRDKRLAALSALDGLEYMDGVRQLLRAIEIEQPAEREPLPALTRALYGYLGYGIGGMLEPKLSTALPPHKAETRLVLPGQVVLYDHLRHRCCYLSLDDNGGPKPAKLGDAGSFELEAQEPTATPNREEFMAGVVKAKELITDGEGIQLVLSVRFATPFSGQPFGVYRRLRQANPSPFMFFMRFEDETLLGSSPEMLVRCDGGRLEVRPIAGTRPRGETEALDMALERELLADPKERAEHVMLVDLGRNDLGRIATAGSVEVAKFMCVERFSHVMHLTSYVEADLKDGLDAIDVLTATFPAGTVAGAPKIWAMETIAKMEQIDRGPYAGAMGWLGVGKGPVHLGTGITIRSMWMRGGVCSWQAGAGLVYDSEPEKEWQECNNKARIIREILSSKGVGDVFADR
ncbi:MAG: anthranilate synthase component I family protein [Humidesulfovibrio sp.]|nr:anthranilate synthase component I family protein [Humidesulfovibrio sp.]